MKKIVGKVSEDEKQAIQTLFERKNGLAELLKMLPVENTALYEKLVQDMSDTHNRFQKWWDDMAAKYHWESHSNGNWQIDFQTCDVFLVIN